jgi:type VI protein secretion system component Hcp
LRYSATGAIIAQVSASTSGDRTTETVTISFGKVVIGMITDGPDVSDHLPWDLAHRAE